MGLTTMPVFDFCREIARTCNDRVRMVDEIAFTENCVAGLSGAIGAGVSGTVSSSKSFDFAMINKGRVVQIESDFNWSRSPAYRARAISSFCDDFDPPPPTATYGSFVALAYGVDQDGAILEDEAYLQSSMRDLLGLVTSDGTALVHQGLKVLGLDSLSVTKPEWLLLNPTSLFKSLPAMKLLPKVAPFRPIPVL